ncbi:MAG: hypothetical protein IJV50_07555 [Lachnospiraceae bacterium]|nr:hypothetical protein [Lachnospiraceae bacterium]
MIFTIILSIVMMVGLFLMLWSAVGFIQNKKFFTSAPKAGQEVIQPKEERFRGQHVVGWLLMILALALLVAPVIFGAYDGIQKEFEFCQFFIRFAVMLLLLKAFDILFFDYYLLCRSDFFPHYYPEVKDIYGPEIFGYNWKSHLLQIVLMLLGAMLAAWICTLIS